MAVSLSVVKDGINLLNKTSDSTKDILSTSNKAIGTLAKIRDVPTTSDLSNLKQISLGGLTFPIRPNSPSLAFYSKSDPTSKLINSVLIPGGESISGLLKSGSDGLFSILPDVTLQLSEINTTLFDSLTDITDSVGTVVTNLVPIPGFDINLDQSNVLSGVTSSLKSTGISPDILGVSGTSFDTVSDFVTSPLERITDLTSSIGGEFVAGLTNEFLPSLPTQVGLPGLESVIGRFEDAGFDLTTNAGIAGLFGGIASQAMSVVSNSISSAVNGITSAFGF